MSEVKVLAVDDKPENLLVLEELLDGPGVTVIRALSGNDALALTLDHDLALILLDVQMPGMNGFEIAELLRGNARTRTIPIIFVSAENRERHDVFKGYDAGAVDYLVKPIEPRLLKNKVGVFLELARQRNELRAKTLELDAKISEMEELQQQLEEKNEQLKLLSCLDGLTGVVNRRRFDEILGDEWKRAQRNGSTLSLILADVDFFKDYNDNYGHVAGDECLRRVAKALSGTVRRQIDTLARYGGEEFAAILPETSQEGAEMVVRHMQEAVSKLEIPHNFSKAGDSITFSFGICSVVPERDMTAMTLVKAADRAMYEAKQAGRNRCRVCQDFCRPAE
ncbi:MAG: diguanylate cyclase domain-containing protein [Thermodesulfobacteriota bacterium]